MTSVLNSKLMKDSLIILSRENDYVASAMLSYMNQHNKLKNYLKNNYGNETNIQELLKINKETLDSSNYLANIFKVELKNYPKKLNNEKDFNTLILVYLKENILKFCDDKAAFIYYKELNSYIEKNIKAIDMNDLAAIALRALKILKELEQEKNYDAMKKFVSMLTLVPSELNKNIIYIIYFGLNFSNQTLEERRTSYFYKKAPDKVLESILNNESILPDSIIKHLCSDNQFKDVNPIVLSYIMSIIFMYSGDMGYEDYSIMVKKIIKNDLNNLDEEAKFYNIRKLCDIVTDVFNRKRKISDISDILWDIKCDNLVFYEVEEDSYGSI